MPEHTIIVHTVSLSRAGPLHPTGRHGHARSLRNLDTYFGHANDGITPSPAPPPTTTASSTTTFISSTASATRAPLCHGTYRVDCDSCGRKGRKERRKEVCRDWCQLRGRHRVKRARKVTH